jgi:hypothetical protein
MPIFDSSGYDELTDAILSFRLDFGGLGRRILKVRK